MKLDTVVILHSIYILYTFDIMYFKGFNLFQLYEGSNYCTYLENLRNWVWLVVVVVQSVRYYEVW